MSNLITAENLIKKAKKQTIDLGKGDPYNRLRYYTKIGWLPHMERKKDIKGRVVGHYPEWALSRLENIQVYKNKGLTNDQITLKLKVNEAKRNFSKIFGFFNTPEKRFQVISYISLAILILILVTEMGLIQIGNTTKQELLNTTKIEVGLFNQLIESGSGVVLTNENMVFIKTSKLSPQTKVHITFEGNYAPATRYWIAKKISFEGFYIELDTPVAQTTNFNWWLTN